jgi:hypothetical protein
MSDTLLPFGAEVVTMTGWSNGNSFANGSSHGASAGSSVPDGRRVPPWKFGVGPAAMSDDRHYDAPSSSSRHGRHRVTLVHLRHHPLWRRHPGPAGMNRWRTSTWSGYNDCVEVGAWRKSSRSGATNCVEVGSGTAVVGVRDTKLAQSPVLAFSPQAWTRFTAQIREAA